ncbi:MAG: endospore germination permease [Clostridia bacterium]|nr:endospore germination permease [Clostridia bacterium]
MNKRIINFGKYETASVLVNALIVKVLLGLPQLLCKQTGNAAWMVALISGLAFLVLVLFIMRLYKRFPNKNIITISEELGGSALKWFAAVLIILPLIFKGAITLRLSAETINLITPYRIPSFLTAVLVGIVIIAVAYKGTEGAVRLHAVFVPVIVAALILVIIASCSSFRLSNLFPLWGLGEKEVIKTSASAILMYSDLIYILLLYPYVKSEKVFGRAVGWGVVLAVIIQLAIVLGYVLTTQYPESGELFMPVYQVSRIIRLGDNSQSIEAIFYPVWISSSLLYLTLTQTFVVEILGQASKTKYEKLFIVPTLAAMFVIGYMPKSVTYAMQVSQKASPILFICTVALPILIMIFAYIKNRRMPYDT